MLPLHRSCRNSVTAFLSILIFTSCTDRSRTDRDIIAALDESVENSNLTLSEASKEMMHAFEDKLRDPVSGERSGLWYPKAVIIQQLSGKIITFIDSLKTVINSKHRFSSGLFQKLMNYKNDILRVDPRIAYEFQRSMRIFTRAIDSATTNRKGLFQNYFDNASKASALAMLNKIQNNVRIIEGKIIAFCYEQSSRLRFGPCTFITAMAIQNSSIVQPGERLEILSGVGEFNKNCNPEVFVYGKAVPLDESGIANYKVRAPVKPGKYYVPVKIIYTNQDGKAVTVEKEITYTVADMEKQ